MGWGALLKTLVGIFVAQQAWKSGTTIYDRLAGNESPEEEAARMQVEMAKAMREQQREGQRKTLEFLSNQQRQKQLMSLLPMAMNASAPLSQVTQGMTSPQFPAPTPPPAQGGMRFSDVLGLAG